MGIRNSAILCKPTKTNGGRTRNLPVHNPEKWELFKAYNKRDVEVEMSIQQKLHKFPVPDFVWEEYYMDQRINDRGIALDWQVVENAIQIDAISKQELLSAMKEITKLENPNSVLQMREWLLERGVETDSLDKKTVATMMKGADAELYEVLSLRQQIAKSSVKKYQVRPTRIPEKCRRRRLLSRQHRFPVVL